MTVTNYPEVFTSQDPNLTNLSLSRLLARLEHNLLSSSADLKPLRRSEYQRMRVGAVCPPPLSLYQTPLLVG
jgi:hypothetical protein